MKNVFFNYHKGLVKTITIALISYLLIQSPFLFALDKIYWVNQRDKKIQRSDFNGSNMESIITTGMDRPYGIAIDKVKGKIYWTDWGLDKITMSNLDGSGITTIVSTGLKTPLHIEVDPLGGKIYWVDSESKTVHRANLDGSNRETIVSGLNSSPIGIDLDLINGKIYWSAYGPGTAEGVIQRANLNGTNVENVTSAIDPNGLALDIAHNKIYWINGGFVSGGYYVPAPEIWWCDLNGSNKRKLLSQGTGSTFLPTDLATDSDGGKIYWTESVSKGWESGYEKIMRANLNGSNVEALITDIPGDPTPIGIALLLDYTPSNIIANFSGTPISGTAPLTVQFTDQSTGSITSRLWDFGDGQTSTATNPSHTYQNTGTYTVKLTVTGTGGSNTKTRSNYISVSSSSAPVANFSGTPTSGTAPLAVQFTDQSTGNITSRSWNFGDGQSSTSANPSHTYQNPGNYTVKLQVTGVGGTQSKINSEYISVYSQPNLLVNGNFSDGEEPWMIYSHDPAAATGNIENGEYSIAITNGGQEEWHIQFSQTNVQVTNNSSYKVSFDAYAISPRTIRAHIGMNADPWTAYSAFEEFSLTNQKQTFTYNFTMNYPTDQVARIVFDVGKSTSNVHFDNITLFQISDIGQTIMLIEPFDVLPQLDHWGINDNSHITTSITNTTKEGTGALKMDWQVQAIESWGGSTGFWMWNSSNSYVWDLLGYEYLSLWYYISQASSAPGHTYVQIEMWEVSNAPINTNNGDLTEKWNTYQKILDDTPGWKELQIPLVALQTSSEHGFWLADWSQNKGNYQLDLNKIRGFYIGINVDQALYQSNPDIARGIIIIDHLSAKKSLTEISNESKPFIRKEFSLLQNYPNPFNPTTTISYSLTGRSGVKLSVYNLLGEEISVLEDGIKEIGYYSVKFDASHFKSGIYLYKLETNDKIYIRKMTLLR